MDDQFVNPDIFPQITSMQKVLLAIYSILILLFVISILVIVGWNPQTDNNILSAAEQLYYVK